MQIRRPRRWLPHTDRGFALAGTLIGGTLLLSALVVGPVLAVHDLPFFQLDRDYQVNLGLGNTPPGIGRANGEDWDVIYGAVNGTDTTNAIDFGWAADLPDGGDDILQGAKDTTDFPTWTWRLAKPGDTSNVLDFFSAAYVDPDPSRPTFGHRLAYFGMDRYATNGNFSIGIWLLHNPVAKLNGGQFLGSHDPNDILVQADFQGGQTTLTSVRVFRWSAIQAHPTSPVPFHTSAQCLVTGAEANVCFVSNDVEFPTIWPYTPKSAPTTPGNYPADAAIEGGIDLTALGITGCFADAMVTTRVSTSSTANADDFMLGSFTGCATPTIQTSLSGAGHAGPSITVPPSTPVTDHITLGNTADGAIVGGTVTYRVFADAGCTEQVFSSGPLAVVGGVPPASDPFVTPVPNHTFFWLAEYSGDEQTYNPASSACGAETQTTARQPVTVETSLTGGGQSGSSITISLGDSVQDEATIHGAFGIPTGTITYRVYTDAACKNLFFAGNPLPVDGSGAAASEVVTPVTAGTYHVRAFYSGDTRNAASASACGDEVLTVAKLDTAMTTALVDVTAPGGAQGPTMTVQVPARVRDEATLIGVRPTAGGTVRYEVFGNPSCTGTPIAAVTRPVTNGAPAPSTPITITNAGTTYWRAAYSGDANHASATSACGDEILTAAPATPALTTVLTPEDLVGGRAFTFPPGSIVVVTDQAEIVDGAAPTGTVTYQAFDNETCSGPPVDTQTVAVGANGSVPATDPITFTAAGVYTWVVTYSGDDDNRTAGSDCGEEVVAIGLASPTLTTALSSGSRNGPALTVPLGTTVTDQATLHGATANAGGQVGYGVFADPDCHTPVPGPNNPSSVPVTNGDVPASDPVTFDLAGVFYWRAGYSGDANNAPFLTGCIEETLTVAKASVAVTTALVGAAPDGSLAVAIGDTIHDAATLSGTSASAGGKVIYLVFLDDRCRVAFAAGGTVTVVGGVVGPSNGVVIDRAGTFFVQAEYLGDANNASARSDCTSEVVTAAKDQTSVTTTLATAIESGAHLRVPYATTVTDQATIEGLGPGAAGEVTYTVYLDAGCASIFAPAGSAPVADTFVGPSEPITFFDAAAYFWKAAYSGDANHEPSTSDCTAESVVVSPARLDVLKTVDAPEADPGQTLHYEITVTNNEQGPVSGITVTDDISDVLAWGRYQRDCNLSCTFQLLRLRWDNVAIPGGSALTLTYSIMLDESGFPVGSTVVQNSVVAEGAPNDCPPGFLRGNCGTDTPVIVAPAPTPTPPTPTPPTPTPTNGSPAPTGSEEPITTTIPLPPTDTAAVPSDVSSGGVALIAFALVALGGLGALVPWRRARRRAARRAR